MQVSLVDMPDFRCVHCDPLASNVIQEASHCSDYKLVLASSCQEACTVWCPNNKHLRAAAVEARGLGM